ncbi:hypothetical protein [Dysgonomonas massiliensis]|uniref:hypothetical protein n=1 Tax=Dysgonomonas massiliensis TaxID=2040292 RepID=UPI000C7737DA|nr:hypothetical protein [Dysgonomonas massiliensis]
MGQNYSESTYRKTYDGDYVKSYEDKALVKKELERRVKSYKEITQQEGAYSKQEKGIYDPGNTERTIDVLDKPIKRIPTRKLENRNQGTIKQSVSTSEDTEVKEQKTAQVIPPPVPEIKVVSKEQSPKPIVPKVQVVKETELRKNTNSKVRDYDAYRALVMLPVREEANGVYREMVNKELIDEKEARKILDYAGYKEKKSLDFIKFGLFALIATILLQLAGAIGAMAWSYFYRQRTHVVLEKKMGFSNLTIRMPANKKEKDDILANGMIYMGISAVMFIVAIIRMSAS